MTISPQERTESMSASLLGWLDEVGPYQGYTYGYPHKTAYRPLPTARRLSEVWSREPKDALFLYLHIPFCEMRCGFCNLFTRALPKDDLEALYLGALEKQARAAVDSLGTSARFARIALGGGTPTFLETSRFVRVLDLIEGPLGASLSDLPVSLETSPDTSSPDKLEEARRRGVDRISIGIQSFFDEELKALGRPTTAASARAALDRIREAGFPTLNIDLIYGVSGQSLHSWMASVDEALRWRPEQLYLYPLYVRPLTGLGRRANHAHDQRPECYRRARERLLSEGYRQVSMRMFEKPSADAGTAPPYSCQDDGMLGLGCGARSYTHSLHYSEEWAVSRTPVGEIIRAWTARPDDEWDRVWHGYVLGPEDQRVRYILQGLLQVDGLDRAAYRARFAGEDCARRPDLSALLEEGLATLDTDRIRLAARGLELSDAIGPWLYTDSVRSRMKEYVLR